MLHSTVCRPPTSSDLTHGCDRRVVRWDASQWFGLYRSVAWDSQNQCKQPLVPAEGLLGQLAPRQWCGERQMELEEKVYVLLVTATAFSPAALIHVYTTGTERTEKEK